MNDEQARQCTTVDELTLGGIIKHIGRGYRVWAQLILCRDGALPDGMLDLGQYPMADDETLAGLLDAFDVAARTLEQAVRALPDVDIMVPLPQMLCSPRRIVLHLMRETAQHAGHADIIRESLDGASTTAQLAT